MTVRELLARIGGDELAEWEAFHKLQPFGSDIESWRAAQSPTVIANVHCKRTFTNQDFMPQLGGPREQSDEEIKVHLLAWTASHNSSAC